MAGRVLKITLEGTHPPIWRRVVIPDQISFRDLHDIIQILFGWGGYHLHCFENYKYNFIVDCQEDFESASDSEESTTLVDDYIEELPWIRYTYDFGDDWNHKIQFEKYDFTYELRHATLIKYKGNNPVEDCGGVSPWMELQKFCPSDTQAYLEQMHIPKRKATAKKNSGIEEVLKNSPELEFIKDFMDELFERTRQEIPMLKNASDDELMDVFINHLADHSIPGDMSYFTGESNDPELQRQMDLINDNSLFTIVQSRKKMQKNLASFGERTIADYMKYCRFTSSNHEADCAELAEYMTGHTDILFYFFYQDEMKDLLSFWDYYKAGHKEVQARYLNSIAKACSLGLIKLTGKRKFKLELCAEFGQIMKLIQLENVDSYYNQIEENVAAIGTLLMAYTALSIEQFYELYSAYAKAPLERNAFEKFIYWNGTMNHALTTFYNNLTDVNYLTLPDMQPRLHIVESIDMHKLFQSAPRDISREELSKWRLGFNKALPEWEDYLTLLQDESEGAEAIVFSTYMDVAAGTSMTELIMRDLMDATWGNDEMDDTELSILEADIWHTYAKLCLVTPILGLNGYSREQYAEKFHVPLDYIPLFNDNDLSKQVNKRTRIFELPREIQLEMMEAVRKGEGAYRRCIERLCKKYKSNQALYSEHAVLVGGILLGDGFDNAEKSDYQKIIYPWGMDGLDMSKPETYVRKNQKIGRNDPCPCGSGKKYKRCCGK